MALAWKLFFTRRCCGNTNLSAKWRRYLRAVLYTFNIHTLILSGIAVLAVYLCDLYDFKYNMDFTLVATGTTFPLVFTIQQAFQRRERATQLLADLKASAVALYYMHRDWDQTESYPATLPNNSSSWSRSVRAVLREFLVNLHGYLTTFDGFENHAEKRLLARRREVLDLLLHNGCLEASDSRVSFFRLVQEIEEHSPNKQLLSKCYKALSKLSVMNEQLTVKAGYTRGGEGGMSRTAQYLRYMVSGMENLRMIHDYRTPVMMRYACGVLFHIFAVILAPYFLHFCDSWVAYGHDEDNCPAGYAASVVYVMIVMLLYHIQSDLEQPFAGMGLDDVFVELAPELDDVVAADEDVKEMLSRGSSVRASEFGTSPHQFSNTHAKPYSRRPSHEQLASEGHEGLTGAAAARHAATGAATNIGDHTTWHSTVELSGLGGIRAVSPSNNHSTNNLANVKRGSALHLTLPPSPTVANMPPCTTSCHLMRNTSSGGGFPSTATSSLAKISSMPPSPPDTICDLTEHPGEEAEAMAAVAAAGLRRHGALHQL